MPLRVRRIADVEQQAVALAGAAGEADRRIDVMSWHWVGPAAAGPAGLADHRGDDALAAPARSAALSAAVGAPLPPRALTMLSSSGSAYSSG